MGTKRKLAKGDRVRLTPGAAERHGLAGEVGTFLGGPYRDGADRRPYVCIGWNLKTSPVAASGYAPDEVEFVAEGR